MKERYESYQNHYKIHLSTKVDALNLTFVLESTDLDLIFVGTWGLDRVS